VKGCVSKDATEYAMAGLPTCFSNLHIKICMSLVDSLIYSVTHQSKLLRTTAALLSKYEAKSRWVSSSLSTYVEPMVTGFWRYRRAGR
jgi:hypothetical protein